MEQALWDQVEAFLAAEGVALDDLDLRGGGKARILQVTVDAEGGVGVDRIADLSRGLSRLLDEADAIPGAYTLEVTSPGLERPLRRREHFEKSVGREVVVKTSAPVGGEHSHRGMLEAVQGEDVIVTVGEERRAIPFGEITGARTVYRWEAKAKPGRK